MPNHSLDTLMSGYGATYRGLEFTSWTARMNAIMDSKFNPGDAEAIVAACAQEADARDIDTDQPWISLATDIYARYLDSNGDRRGVAALQLEAMANIADGNLAAGF